MRMAVSLASVNHLEKEEMRQCFEEGRLPCSFSLKLLWAPVAAILERIEEDLSGKLLRIAEEQRKRQEAFKKREKAQRKIQKLEDRIATFKAAEQHHENQETTLKEEIREWQALNLPTLKQFARTAAETEEELVTQLEAQLEVDRSHLLANHERGGPKLGLLLNCFGAEEATINVLAEFNGGDFAKLTGTQLDSLVSTLASNQRTVVRYTHERLNNGKLPFIEHDCILCDCETPSQMASFLRECGLPGVTEELIRQTGASGRGALLFLSAKDLKLGNRKAIQKALTKSRSRHLKR